jgi:hypothetical protein
VELRLDDRTEGDAVRFLVAVGIGVFRIEGQSDRESIALLYDLERILEGYRFPV